MIPATQQSSRSLQAVALCLLSGVLVGFALLWHESGEQLQHGPMLGRDQVGQSRWLAAGDQLGQLKIVARQLGLDPDGPISGILGYGRQDGSEPKSLPSTDVVRKRLEDFQDVAVVSVVLDPRDWQGEHGIYDNPMERGKDSHRGACVSMFVNGELVGETTAGVCIHGGMSRNVAQKSMRVMFTPAYGATLQPANFLPGAMGNNLVLHNDMRRRPFCNPMAYEMMARLGCDVPRTRPVRVMVNGELMHHIYFATEHLSESYFGEKLGHENFILHNERGGWTKVYLKAIHRLRKWDQSTVKPFEEFIDCESVISWLTGVLICAAIDNRQGIAYLDQRDKRWQWVVWDLDWAFQPWPTKFGENVVTDANVTENLIHGWGDLRSALYGKLMPQDCDFRRDLLARVTKALNHELTDEWFTDLVGRYHAVATRFGKPASFHRVLDEMLQFMLDRPPLLRAELDAKFGVGPVFTSTIRVPEGAAVTVDGFRYERDVTCHYFAGQELTVAAPQGWQLLLDGEVVAEATNTFRANRNLSFELVRR